MDEIIVVGDIHEGMSFERKIDPETGISARALDIHSAFVYSARYAIEHKSKLFVILGDLFDRSHVSPGFRELVRRDIIEPLGQAGVEVWLLAGNHDQPRSFRRATSLDDYRGYGNVSLFKKPDKRIMEIDTGGCRLKVGAVIVPYLHPEQIADIVEKEYGKEVPKEQWNALSQRLMKSFLENSVSDLRAQGASQVVIFAHYYITGSKLSKASYTQVLPDEFQFTRDMFPHGVDLGVFGHIHVHQQVMENPPVLYTGSVEHMDWGEWEDDKGFISLSISGEEKGGGLSGCIGSSLDEGHRGKISWSFVKLPTRKIRRIRVSINADDDNPTERILAAIPQDVSGSMLRVDIRTRDAVRKRIDETRLARRLQDAFDYELMYSETDSGTVGVTGFTADPFELVREFIELNYKKDPRYGELQKCAREILDEVLK